MSRPGEDASDLPAGDNPKRSTLGGGLLAMLVGAVVLTHCGWEASRTATFLSRAKHTTGVILEPTGHPLIRFEAADGEMVTFLQNGFASGARGETVRVAYDAQNPAETARVATFLATWGPILVDLPMGVGFLLLPLLGVRFELAGRYGNGLRRR